MDVWNLNWADPCSGRTARPAARCRSVGGRSPAARVWMPLAPLVMVALALTGCVLPSDPPSPYAALAVVRDGDGLGRPELIGGVAPAINGAIRVQQGPHSAVTIDGALAQYPSVEIIRDYVLPNGYFSSLIFTKAQESGGPLNLYEPGEKFSVAG
jgi:hypothetical protein